MVQIQRAGVVACSDGLPAYKRDEQKLLAQTLHQAGTEAVFGRFLYADERKKDAGSSVRVQQLMNFYKDPGIDTIFDISGGDLANELLDELDYARIGSSKITFWGYSDLTSIMNGIYAKTGKSSVLYQIRNLVKEKGEIQRQRYFSFNHETDDSLFRLSGHFLKGNGMEGIILGGNIRCLLKLAGTPFFPDMRERLLLLESYGGKASRISAYFHQLKQMGVFQQIKGIVLGTFTELEQKDCSVSAEKLLLQVLPKEIPVFQTSDIGHGADAKAVWIGRWYHFSDQGVCKNLF